MYVSGVLGACGNQKRVLDPLELELHVIVKCPKWVLGTRLRASALVAYFGGISPALQGNS